LRVIDASPHLLRYVEGAGAHAIVGVAVRDVGVSGELIFVDFLALLRDFA
jgi:hypothetical protein